MKGLITVINEEEAKKVVSVGCDILDIKNPSEGSLGANFPWVIEKIMKIVPKNMESSIAVGDVPFLPGTISLAVRGAASFHPDYIKVGLKGPQSKEEAIELMKKAVYAAKSVDKNIKIVATLYADYQRAGTIDPLNIPEIADESGAAVAMVDTAIKDGKTLVDIITYEKLKTIVKESKKRGLKVAFAGSLKPEHVKKIRKTGADVFGVRGAVCSGGERKAELKSALVRKLMNDIRG